MEGTRTASSCRPHPGMKETLSVSALSSTLVQRGVVLKSDKHTPRQNQNLSIEANSNFKDRAESSLDGSIPCFADAREEVCRLALEGSMKS